MERGKVLRRRNLGSLGVGVALRVAWAAAAAVLGGCGASFRSRRLTPRAARRILSGACGRAEMGLALALAELACSLA